MKYTRGKTRQEIAKKHISELYDFTTNPQYPLEYRKKSAELIFKISQKFKVSLEKKHKVLLCKKCHSFLLDTNLFSIRLKEGHLVYKCKKKPN
jgi:RNase P subunit RPR2